MRMATAAAALALIVLQALPGVSRAQILSSEPIKIMVGFSPGGSVDFVARLLANKLGASLNQTVIVENRPGAGEQIAANYVAQEAPSSNTLLFAIGSDLSWTKLLSTTKVVDPLTDLTPIATAVRSVSCIFVKASSPYKTFDDLMAYVRKYPNKLSYGSTGRQSYYYLVGEALRELGVPMLHVPYKGVADIDNAVLAGDIDVGLSTLGLVNPLAAAGNVRMLAVLGPPGRYGGSPGVPNIKEDLPAFNVPQSWFGFFGAPKMPAAAVTKLNTEVTKIMLSDADVASKIKSQDLEPLTMTVAETRDLIQTSTGTFSDLIKAAKIHPNDD